MIPLPSLVVCPPTLTGHWYYEVKKFCDTNDLDPLQYAGSPVTRARYVWGDVIVITALCNLQARSHQTTSLHKDCLSRPVQIMLLFFQPSYYAMLYYAFRFPYYAAKCGFTYYAQILNEK